jgi:hypothetical protein
LTDKAQDTTLKRWGDKKRRWRIRPEVKYKTIEKGRVQGQKQSVFYLASKSIEREREKMQKCSNELKDSRQSKSGAKPRNDEAEKSRKGFVNGFVRKKVKVNAKTNKK